MSNLNENTKVSAPETPQPQRYGNMGVKRRDAKLTELVKKHFPRNETLQVGAELHQVTLERDEARAHADALAAALRKIAYDPIGASDATPQEVLEGIENIARTALSAYEGGKQ